MSQVSPHGLILFLHGSMTLFHNKLCCGGIGCTAVEKNTPSCMVVATREENNPMFLRANL